MALGYLSSVVSRILGGPQAVSGIGWAPPEPIHWSTRGMARERENHLFGRVISVHLSHPKQAVSRWIRYHADQWWACDNHEKADPIGI